MELEPAMLPVYVAEPLPWVTCAHIRPTCKNNNMADQVEESSSFHEMGLDDRLVKVTNIFAIL